MLLVEKMMLKTQGDERAEPPSFVSDVAFFVLSEEWSGLRKTKTSELLPFAHRTSNPEICLDASNSTAKDLRTPNPEGQVSECSPKLI